MLAFLVGRLAAVVAAADHRSHAGPGRQHVARLDGGGGKLLGAGRQQVGEFGAADPRVLPKAVAMIEIGGADHRRALPGEHEHRSPVRGVHEAEGMGHRQAPGRQQ